MQTPTNDQQIVRVAVDAPLLHSLDYLVAVGLRIEPGSRVRVHLGRRLVAGLVLGDAKSPDPKKPQSYKLKTISEVLDKRPTLPADIVAMIDFAARYYWAAPGSLARAALPPGLQNRPGKYFITSSKGQALLQDPGNRLDDDDRALLRFVFSRRKSKNQILAGGWSAQQMQNLVAQDLLDNDPNKVPPAARNIIYFQVISQEAIEHLPAAAKRMRQVIDWMRTNPGEDPKQPQRHRLSTISQAVKGAASALKRLQKLGWVQRSEGPTKLPDLEQLGESARRTASAPEASPELSQAQQEAVQSLDLALSKKSFQGFLLHGVTASGKTEVYLAAAAQTLAQGRDVLVLVPEIALTPQLVGRFQRRLDTEIEVLHSGIPAAERRRRWQRIRAGQAHCVIGARSAIFAPLADLGLVVIDEEHDGSYKQDEAPRYNARDLALWRAHHQKSVCLLGSATPSLESFHRASEGALQLLQLPDRVTGGPLPRVDLVSLTPQISPRSASHDENDLEILTPQLLSAITGTLERKEQAILFLNRRGFSNFVICADCGEIVGCPNCSVSLTHHRAEASLRCHYCDYHIAVPQTCVRCQGPRLIPFGLGTERLEAEVRKQFPQARIARLDRDATRRKGSLLSTLQRFGEGKIDILVGTQMLAKGHDYPGVTLVGVIVADTGLAVADFRASERTFQLLAQVSGRAGRGDRPGQVIVQAFDVGNPLFAAAQEHDFIGFAESELDLRRLLRYPPFGRLALLRFEARDAHHAEREAKRIVHKVRAQIPKEIELLGPAPAPLAKLRGMNRIQVLVKAPNVSMLQACLQKIHFSFSQSQATGIRLVFDVDPTLVL